MLCPEIDQATKQLVGAIRQSEEYRAYETLRDLVMENDQNRTLLARYQKTQTTLQMAAFAGREADPDDVRLFEQLSGLLYMNAEVAQYLLAQMRVQKLAGEIFGRIGDAVGLQMELPGL